MPVSQPSACSLSRTDWKASACASVAQRLQNNFRPHALHAEKPLLARRGLAPLLTGDIRDIGGQHALFGEHPLERIADEKARAVRIRQNDQARRLHRMTKQAQKRRIFHVGKAVRGKNSRIHQLQKRVPVVFSLDHNGLPELYLIHAAPPAPAGRSAAPEAAPGRPRWSSWRRPSAKPARPPAGRSCPSRGAPPSWSAPRGSS